MSGKPIGVTGGATHHPLPSSAANISPAASLEGKTSSGKTVEKLPADAAQTSSSSVQSSESGGGSKPIADLIKRQRVLDAKQAAAAKPAEQRSPTLYPASFDDPDGTMAAKDFFKSMNGENAVARHNKDIFDKVDSVIWGEPNDEVVNLGKELLAAAQETRKSIADDIVRAVACRIGKHYQFTGADMASRKNEVADLAARLGDSRGSYRSMTPIAMGLRIAIDPTTPDRVGNFSAEERAAALKLGKDNQQADAAPDWGR